MTYRHRAVLLGLLVTLSLLVGAFAGASAATTVPLTIDDDHELATDHKQGEFERTGSATASIDAPEFEFAVASSHDTCDIGGFHSDLRNDYFCVRYEEEIERTVRIYIPESYWSPYLRKSVQPVAGDQAATFEPVEDGKYTAVTFTVTEPGLYAWPINGEASWFSGVKERSLENIENVTGVGVPDQDSWQYIDATQLGGNKSAYVVRAPNGTDAVILEYQTGEDEWSKVPDGQKDYAPVYAETKDGVDDRVYVFATTTDPPAVRYKTEPRGRDKLGSALREIGQAPARLEELLNIDIPFLGN